MQACAVVPSPPMVELPAEVREGTEAHPTHELLCEGSVKSLQFPSPLRVVRASVYHADTLLLAVTAELPRNEAASVVNIHRLGLAPTLDGPPEVVDRFSSALPPVSPSHDQEARPIVQDRVHEDFSDPRDAELVDIHLPKGIHMVTLEAFEGLGFSDNTNHEPMPFQDTVNSTPTDTNPSPREDRVDPQSTPGGVPPPQLKDTIGEIPVNAVGVVARTARLIPKAFNTVLPIVPAPIP